MINTLAEILGSIDTLLKLAVTVLAVAWVAGSWLKSRSFVNTISAIIMAAIVVWATSNVSLLKEKVGEDFEGSSGSTSSSQGLLGF